MPGGAGLGAGGGAAGHAGGLTGMALTTKAILSSVLLLGVGGGAFFGVGLATGGFSDGSADNPLELTTMMNTAAQEKESVRITERITTGGSGTISANCVAKVGVDDPGMDCSWTFDDTPQVNRMILTGDAFYVKIPGFISQPGKPWQQLSGTDAAMDDAITTARNQLRQLTDFRQLIPDNATIASAGEEQLNGMDTTRYRITLRDENGRVSTSDVWTADNLPVQIRTTQNIQGLGQLRMTAKYTDWGTPVQIQPPPANQTAAPI
jgi:hypothetical protein